MSLVINAVGSGSSGDSDALVYDSLVNKKVPYAFVKSDGATGTLSKGPFYGITTYGQSNSVQYAYLRLGPVNLTGVDSIKADISASGSTGTCRAVLFVSELPEDQSYNSTATAAIRSGSGARARDIQTLDTSSLSGMFYVYAGTDSGGAKWESSRSSVIYGVQLMKQT